jgi:hypothetical protein
MGDRVLFQVVSGEDFSPVVYCHSSGAEVRDICARLQGRMRGRHNDLHYTAARLVQECIRERPGNLSFGMWNAVGIQTEADSHGDGGVVLIDVSGPQMEFKCFGGYWATATEPGDLPRLMTYDEQSSGAFYSALKAVNS